MLSTSLSLCVCLSPSVSASLVLVCVFLLLALLLHLTPSSYVPLHPCDLPKSSLPLLPQSLCRSMLHSHQSSQARGLGGSTRGGLSLCLGWYMRAQYSPSSAGEQEDSLHLLEPRVCPPPRAPLSVQSHFPWSWPRPPRKGTRRGKRCILTSSFPGEGEELGSGGVWR